MSLRPTSSRLAVGYDCPSHLQAEREVPGLWHLIPSPRTFLESTLTIVSSLHGLHFPKMPRGDFVLATSTLWPWVRATMFRWPQLLCGLLPHSTAIGRKGGDTSTDPRCHLGTCCLYHDGGGGGQGRRGDRERES